MGRPIARACLTGLAICGALTASGPVWAQQNDLAWTLQQVLADKGCYRAKVDGLWGPASRQALALILEEQRGQRLTASQLTPTQDNLRRVQDSGLRCKAREQVAKPQQAAQPQPRRTDNIGGPRTVTISRDCPGPGCPLGPGEAIGDTLRDLFR